MTGSAFETDSKRPTLLSGAIFTLLCVWIVFGVVIYGAVDTGTVAILAVLAAAVLLLWLADGWRNGSVTLRPVLLLPLIGWAVIAAIQLLPLRDAGVPTGVIALPAAASLSLDPYATRFFLMRLLICIVFFAAMLTFLDSRSRQLKLSILIVAFGTVIAFFGILQWLAHPESIYGLRPTPQAIPFGPYVNQHHFAALMEMTLGVNFGVLFLGNVKKDKKPLLIIAAVLMTIAVVLTGSRGGMISLLCVFAVVLFGKIRSERIDGSTRHTGKHDRSRVIRLMTWLSPVLLIAAVVIFLGGGSLLFRGLGIESGQTDLTSGRLHYWQTGWQIFISHPMIGAGFDAFGVAYTRFDTANGLFRVEQAHNDYLQTLADSGILGFICLAGFIFLFAKQCLKSIAMSDGYSRAAVLGAAAGCVGIFVHSFFDFPLRTPGNAFMFLALASIAVTGFGKGRDKKISAR